MKRISGNIGFVTNSSSQVHHFPAEILNHPKVAAFLKAFEIEGGFVGEDLWYRSRSTTVAFTREQKAEIVEKLTREEEACGPAINVDSDEVVLIYDDGQTSIASILTDLICEALAEVQGGSPWDYHKGEEYN